MHRSSAQAHAPRITHLKAFTLVELAVVLVVIGLLVGGVLEGRTLIRAAQVRSIIGQFNSFNTAAATFRMKYKALPGDMTNATTYWGTAHATPATCFSTIGTGTQTCNGDGDGRVVATGAVGHENFRFWQHMANAGLVLGQFSGVAAGGTWSASAANSPTGRLADSYWWPHNWGVSTGASTMNFDGVYHNFLMFGGYTGDYPYAPILTPLEMAGLDAKLDDGKPATGMVVPFGTLSNCTTGSTNVDVTADYKRTSEAKACAAIFRQLWN